jgi:hypothetical protein
VTAPCPACGFCEPAATATWTLALAWDVPSLNDLMRIGTQHWRYKRMGDALRLLIRAERLRLRIPTATGKRRIRVTRYYAGNCKERDHANLVGGCKALVDSLVREGLLVDDKPAFVADSYAQVRESGKTGARLTVVVEELADA